MKNIESFQDLLVKKNSHVLVQVKVNGKIEFETNMYDDEFENVYKFVVERTQVKKNGNE